MLGENVDDFTAKLNSKKISRNDSLDKLRWGYSNIGNFNPKGALALVTKTHNLEPEAKWGNLWRRLVAKGGGFLLARA